MSRVIGFWVVTAPRRESALGDIVWQTNVRGFIHQVLGGLSADDEAAIYTDRDEAMAEGERRLAAYREYRRTLDGEGTK